MSYSSSFMWSDSAIIVQFIAIFSLSKWLGGGVGSRNKKLEGTVKLYFDNYI